MFGSKWVNISIPDAWYLEAGGWKNNGFPSHFRDKMKKPEKIPDFNLTFSGMLSLIRLHQLE